MSGSSSLQTTNPGQYNLTQIQASLPSIQKQQMVFGERPANFSSILNSTNITNSAGNSDTVVTQMQTKLSIISQKQIAYKQAITDYNTAISRGVSYGRFTGQQYKAVLPSGQPGPSAVLDINACEAQCSSRPGCSGATFSSVAGQSNTCTLVLGTGSLTTSSTANTTAIVQNITSKLLVLQSTNADLINSINDANKLISDYPTLLQEYGSLLNNTNGAINTSYDTLIHQREEIRKLLSQYNYFNTDITDSTLGINQSEMLYRFFLLILGLLIFAVCVIRFNINLTAVNLVALGLGLSFLSYIFRMLTISAMLAFAVILYVILR